MSYFFDYLKNYNNWVTIWIFVMTFIISLLFLFRKQKEITIERIYFLTVFLYAIFLYSQYNYFEVLYSDTEGYIWLIDILSRLLFLIATLTIPPAIFLGLVSIVLAIPYCIFLFIKATILGVTIDDVKVIGMSNIYYEKKSRKKAYNKFISLVEDLIKLELKHYPNNSEKINESYRDIKRNYYNNPSYYWNYIEKRASYLKSIEIVSDKEVLLKARNELYKLNKSSKQSKEFIEGINRVINIINILEKKIKQ